MLDKNTSGEVAAVKLRIGWNDAAAKLNDQAAELLSKTNQRPEVAMLDQETADQKVLLAQFKEMLANIKTVGDVIKYAQDVVALQLKDREFTPLVQTGPGPDAGTIAVNHIALPEGFGMGGGLNPFRSLYYQPSRGEPFVLAAHITGKPRDRVAASPINVVLVADAEMVNDMFFEMRERGTMPGQDIVFDFDNVTFALNALDALAGDSRFLTLRARRPQHRTLARFDENTAAARRESTVKTEEQRKAHDDIIRGVAKGIEAAKKEVDRTAAVRKLGDTEKAQLLQQKLNALTRKLDETREDSDREFNAKIDQINNNLEAKIMAMQGTYKLWAVVVPPIPLLVVAACVFFYRRSKEREGISSKRLR